MRHLGDKKLRTPPAHCRRKEDRKDAEHLRRVHFKFIFLFEGVIFVARACDVTRKCAHVLHVNLAPRDIRRRTRVRCTRGSSQEASAFLFLGVRAACHRPCARLQKLALKWNYF